MWLVDEVLTVMFLLSLFAVVYQNSGSQMHDARSLDTRSPFGKKTAIFGIDEPFRPHGRVPPETIQLAVPKLVLPEKINGTKKTVQQDG